MGSKKRCRHHKALDFDHITGVVNHDSPDIFVVEVSVFSPVSHIPDILFIHLILLLPAFSCSHQRNSDKRCDCHNTEAGKPRNQKHLPIDHKGHDKEEYTRPPGGTENDSDGLLIILAVYGSVPMVRSAFILCAIVLPIVVRTRAGFRYS